MYAVPWTFQVVGLLDVIDWRIFQVVSLFTLTATRLPAVFHVVEREFVIWAYATHVVGLFPLTAEVVFHIVGLLAEIVNLVTQVVGRLPVTVAAVFQVVALVAWGTEFSTFQLATFEPVRVDRTFHVVEFVAVTEIRPRLEFVTHVVERVLVACALVTQVVDLLFGVTTVRMSQVVGRATEIVCAVFQVVGRVAVGAALVTQVVGR